MTPRVGLLIGWSAMVVVLSAILFAWTDEVSAPATHAAALLLAAGSSVLMAVGLQPRRVPALVWMPSLCAGWGAGQIAFRTTVYQYVTLETVATWLARASILALAFWSFQDESRRDALKRGLAWFGGCYAAAAVLWSEAMATPAITGTFLNRNHFAGLMVLLLPISLMQLTAEDGRMRVRYVACAGAIFAAVVASGSRACTVIATVEALVCLAVIYHSYAHGWKVLVIAISLACCVIAAGGGVVWQRFQSSDPMAFRREMLTSSYLMFQARPLTGFGLGTWPSVYPAYAVFDPPGIYMNHAHNDWAEWGADGGVGFVSILALLAAWTVWRVRRHTWALGIVGVLAHAFVDFPLHKSALGMCVFFLFGILAADLQYSKDRTTGAGEFSD